MPEIISPTKAIEKLKELGTPIGAFDNKWRSRRVDIFDHPTDAEKVVTFGYSKCDDTFTIAEEPREWFVPYIGRFDGVFE